MAGRFFDPVEVGSTNTQVVYLQQQKFVTVSSADRHFVGMPPKRVRIEHSNIVAGFANALKARRLALGLTQAALAERASLAPNYLTRLEGGTVAPGIDLLERLATALGTTAAELLPVGDVLDESATLKKEAQRLFRALLEKGDTDTLKALVILMSRLGDEPIGRR